MVLYFQKKQLNLLMTELSKMDTIQRLSYSLVGIALPDNFQLNPKTSFGCETVYGVKGQLSDNSVPSLFCIDTAPLLKTETHDSPRKSNLSMVPDTDDDGISGKRRIVNFASVTAGAVVLESSPQSVGYNNLLSEDKDKYGISPCSEKKWVVISLSEDIMVTTIVMTNYEKYSSKLNEFQILGSTSYPVSQWLDLGTYAALPKLGDQTFNLTTPSFVRYLKFKFLTHYGDEFYCTLSQIRVHGSTVIENIQSEFELSNKEILNMQSIMNADNLKSSIDAARAEAEEYDSHIITSSPPTTATTTTSPSIESETNQHENNENSFTDNNSSNNNITNSHILQSIQGNDASNMTSTSNSMDSNETVTSEMNTTHHSICHGNSTDTMTSCLRGAESESESEEGGDISHQQQQQSSSNSNVNINSNSTVIVEGFQDNGNYNTSNNSNTEQDVVTTDEVLNDVNDKCDDSTVILITATTAAVNLSNCSEHNMNVTSSSRIKTYNRDTATTTTTDIDVDMVNATVGDGNAIEAREAEAREAEAEAENKWDNVDTAIKTDDKCPHVESTSTSSSTTPCSVDSDNVSSEVEEEDSSSPSAAAAATETDTTTAVQHGILDINNDSNNQFDIDSSSSSTNSKKDDDHDDNDHGTSKRSEVIVDANYQHTSSSPSVPSSTSTSMNTPVQDKSDSYSVMSFTTKALETISTEEDHSGVNKEVDKESDKDKDKDKDVQDESVTNTKSSSSTSTSNTTPAAAPTATTTPTSVSIEKESLVLVDQQPTVPASVTSANDNGHGNGNVRTTSDTNSTSSTSTSTDGNDNAMLESILEENKNNSNNNKMTDKGDIVNSNTITTTTPGMERPPDNSNINNNVTTVDAAAASSSTDANNATAIGNTSTSTLMSTPVTNTSTSDTNTSMYEKPEKTVRVLPSCIDTLRFSDFQAKLLSKRQSASDSDRASGATPQDSVIRALIQKITTLEFNFAVLEMYSSQVSDCYRTVLHELVNATAILNTAHELSSRAAAAASTSTSSRTTDTDTQYENAVVVSTSPLSTISTTDNSSSTATNAAEIGTSPDISQENVCPVATGYSNVGIGVGVGMGIFSIETIQNVL
eukprot:gene8790-18184_t